MLKDTVAFAKHIEDMMRDTLGVSKEESVEEEDELPEEVEEGKIFFQVVLYLSKILQIFRLILKLFKLVLKLSEIFQIYLKLS